MLFKAYINVCAIAIDTLSLCNYFHWPAVTGNGCTKQKAAAVELR